MFLMFFLDVIFVLFTLHHWTSMNMCPIRQHTLYSYLTGGVKTPSSFNNLVAIHHVPVILLEALKASKLTSQESSSHEHRPTQICSGTLRIFSHFLVLCCSFLFLFRVVTLNILEILRLMFWPCGNCVTFNWLTCREKGL